VFFRASRGPQLTRPLAALWSGSRDLLEQIGGPLVVWVSRTNAGQRDSCRVGSADSGVNCVQEGSVVAVGIESGARLFNELDSLVQVKAGFAASDLRRFAFRH